MKILLFLSWLFVTTIAFHSREWSIFKVKHNKSYVNFKEEKFRQGIFLENKKMIDEHNERHKQGLESYELELNHFGDLSHEEFQGLFTPGNWTLAERNALNVSLQSELFTLPSTVDWRDQGAVGPVKTQGKCGACWAFTAVGAVEAQVFKRSGVLKPLSAQQLVDCSHQFKYHNLGCQGGMPNNAFLYIRDSQGLATEDEYPYEGKENWKRGCKLTGRSLTNSVSLRGFVNLPEGDEKKLAMALAQTGPIAVCIYALKDFRFYKKGIYYNKKCPKYLDVNHAMLLVGYGNTNSGENYWILKNSWGNKWGEKGYMRFAKDRGNNCHIASVASYPVLL